MQQVDLKEVKKIIAAALDEDLGEQGQGDITSNLTIDKDCQVNFQIAARENIILCGADIALMVFKQVSERLKISEIKLNKHFEDGQTLSKGDVIISGFGNARLVFAAERTALNLIQHLSGIASKVHDYVSRLSNNKTQILDTRKTIPVLRALQKYAVKVGGGKNHRFALYDGVLIKDNHIAAAGSVKNAILMAKQGLKAQNKKMLIEVECDNIRQVRQALEAKADIIMLDNMNLKQIASAVKIINNKAKIEVSGGVNLKKIKAISDAGVDYISVGCLTHSVCAVDIGLDILD